MKIRTPCLVLSASAFGLSALVLIAATESPSPNVSPKRDPWLPLRPLLGEWVGQSTGQPGRGETARSYSLILNERFVRVTNRSIYAPQEQNPKGETHEDIGFISYDRAAEKFVLRQFHIEGFVATYVLESMSQDAHTFVFVSTAIENIGPGWRGRETYRIIDQNVFTERFELAEPGKDFALYSEARFRRK